jgi:AGCS family alanine or glycine:cation symporter
MEEKILHVTHAIGNFLWGWPMLVLLIGTGIYLTFFLRGIQFTHLIRAFQLILFSPRGKKVEGDISHFQALMTALSATVGTGNIAGVATAIAAGGPGALFWMWVTGLLGIATKFSEAVLGVYYREKDSNGEMSGGPMYYMTNGLNMRWLAVLFSIFLTIAAVGTGSMVQSNSMALLVQDTFHVPTWFTGAVLTFFAAIVILGGIHRIGKVASALVPFMILVYVGAGIVILFMNAPVIPGIFALIFESAFNPVAATGGFLGATVKEVMRQGLSRGVFSNESGMGSSPIAAAAAKTNHPVEQALVSMTQTFIDTLVVCTFTGLIILVSGLWTSGVSGAELTGQSFSSGLNGIQIAGYELGGTIVTVCLLFFAFSTIIGWAYYGDKGISFVFGEKSIKPYRVIFIASVFLGALIKLELAWSIAEICIALMVLPNLFALILLSRKVKELMIDFFRNEKGEKGYIVKPFYRDH